MMAIASRPEIAPATQRMNLARFAIPKSRSRCTAPTADDLHVQLLEMLLLPGLPPRTVHDLHQKKISFGDVGLRAFRAGA
jgi:hypothetical protein